MHCLSLYLTPPPQVLLHELYGPNSLQPPSTDITTLLPSIHCPHTQIYAYKLCIQYYVMTCDVHWWIHSWSHQQVKYFQFHKILHWVDTTNVSRFPNRSIIAIHFLHSYRMVGNFCGSVVWGAQMISWVYIFMVYLF